MARLRKFDRYAADFLAELQGVFSRYCRGMDAYQRGENDDEIRTDIIRFHLKSGEQVHAFWERGDLYFLYRGKYYPITDLPDDTDDVRSLGS